MKQWCQARVFFCIFWLITAPVVQAQDGDAEADKPQAPPADAERLSVISGLDYQRIAQDWPDQAVWLEPEGGERMVALFEAERKAEARGAVLILADEGVSAAAGVSSALRRPLTEQGWAVMTLGLEPMPLELANARRMRELGGEEGAGPQAEVMEEDGQADAGAVQDDSVMIDVIDEEELDDREQAYRASVQAGLLAATQTLRERGYKQIALAGVGRGAPHVTRFAVEGGNPVALIWIAPDFSPDGAGALPERLENKGGWGILDLHSSDTAPQALARDRAASLMRAGVAGYQRQPVAGGQPPSPPAAAGLANRIAAWLDQDGDQ